MGILTDIDSEWDEEDRVQRIFAVTRFGINNRTSLNRIATRAAATTGVGQRTLVAAAYEEEGLDLVWRIGPVYKSPEEQFPEAKEINYHSVDIERASKFGDILPSWLADRVKLGEFGVEQVLHIWEIPYHMALRK